MFLILQPLSVWIVPQQCTWTKEKPDWTNCNRRAKLYCYKTHTGMYFRDRYLSFLSTFLGGWSRKIYAEGTNSRFKRTKKRLPENCVLPLPLYESQQEWNMPRHADQPWVHQRGTSLCLKQCKATLHCFILSASGKHRKWTHSWRVNANV